MSLNIKDREVHRLAQAITDITGETLTGAVKVALQERYERLQSQHKKAAVAELLAIGKRLRRAQTPLPGPRQTSI